MVVNNLFRARQKWEQLTWVLSRESADARTLGQIYLAVVQLVMIYGLETWVMTPCIRGEGWGGFHHRGDLRLARRKPKRGRYGGWVYPLLEDAIAEAECQ